MKFWQEIVLGVVIGGFFGVVYLSAPVYAEIFAARPEQRAVLSEKTETASAPAETQKVVPPPSPEPKATKAAEPKIAPSNGLKKIVETAIADKKDGDVYGLVVKNFKTGESFILNDDQKFTAASIYKLWVMGEAFRQLKNGEISLDDKMSSTVESLNKTFQISSESAELAEGGITLTVSQALERMITFSDNYAAMLLIKKLKLSQVRQFMKDNDLAHSTFVDSPETTPADLQILLEKLYDGTLVDSESSKEMLGLMSKQQLNYILPKYLPKGTRVAHKTGEIDSIQHDVGIVFSPNGDYLIVLMSDTKFKAQSEIRERLAKLSKGIFEYFQE